MAAIYTIFLIIRIYFCIKFRASFVFKYWSILSHASNHFILFFIFNITSFSISVSIHIYYTLAIFRTIFSEKNKKNQIHHKLGKWTLKFLFRSNAITVYITYIVMYYNIDDVKLSISSDDID